MQCNPTRTEHLCSRMGERGSVVPATVHIHWHGTRVGGGDLASSESKTEASKSQVRHK